MPSDSGGDVPGDEPIFQASLSIHDEADPGARLSLPESIVNRRLNPCKLEPAAIGIDLGDDDWEWVPLTDMQSCSCEFGDQDEGEGITVKVWCECRVLLPLRQLELLLRPGIRKRLLLDIRPGDDSVESFPRPAEVTLFVRVSLSGMTGLSPQR